MADDTALAKKSFFQRPESITTILSFVALALLGFYFLDQILPMVNRVLEFALSAIWKGVLLGVSVIVITWVATNKEWHKLAWYLYQLAMRAITSVIVELDPIGIMKGFVKQLHQNQKSINDALGQLRGQERKLIDKIRVTGEQLQRSQGLAVQAHKRVDQKGMKMEFVLQSRKAGRLEKSSVTYQGLLNRVQAHVSVTEKILEASTFMITDIEDTIAVEVEKRDMIRTSHKAMSAAKSILAANAQREMYDLAMESVTKDYYSKLGEIEQFMKDSEHFVNTMDLENGMYEADALAKIEEWGKRSEKLLTGGSGKTTYQLPSAPSHNFAEEDRKIESSLERGPMADLFGKLD